MTRPSIHRAAGLAAVLAAAVCAPAAWAQGDSPGGAAAKPVEPLSGEQIYNNTCAACHMPDAKGATGAATVPALAGNAKLGVAAYPITIVMVGKGAMPGFSEYLTPAQMAAVITYARTHFGNSYAKPVTVADVATIAAGRPHR